MTSNVSLLEKYLSRLNILSKENNMNVSQAYVRLFPMLLGTPLSRVKFISSFVLPVPCVEGEKSSSLPVRKLHSDFTVNSLESNPYYKKYAEKIKKLQISDPQKFKKRMQALGEIHAKETSDITEDNQQMKDQTMLNKATNKTNSEDGFKSKSKGLDSILKLEKVGELSVEDIKQLWVQHYSQKDAVCAVITSEAYKTIKTVATLWPVFVYPLPRQDGYEMFVGQFSEEEFHFTSLINYQRHQDNAPSQLTLKHYNELEKEKGIVLMSGLVMDDGISVTDAQLLSYQIQHFYNEHLELIKKFNETPDAFDFKEVVHALDGALLSKANMTVK